MTFKINFKTKDNDYVIFVPAKPVGTVTLQEIKEKIGKFELDFVSEYIKGINGEKFYSLSISYEKAKTIKLFEHKNSIDIFVPKDHLNKFVEFNIIKEFSNIELFYSLNRDKVLEAWEKAGYPLFWDVTPIVERSTTINTILDGL